MFQEWIRPRARRGEPRSPRPHRPATTADGPPAPETNVTDQVRDTPGGGGRVLDDTPVGHLVSGPAVCRSHRPGELRVISTEVTSLTTRGAITPDTRAHLYVN